MFHYKFKPEEIFFTSDLHFQHKNMTRGVSTWDSGYRDFDTIELMQSQIIHNINEKVPEDAVLVSCGDFLFGDKKNAYDVRSRINCKNIVHLYGNHCEWLRKDSRARENLFIWVGDYLELYVDKRLVCLFHYAPRVWNEGHRGSYFLYGHSHGSLPDDINSNSIDIGIDTEYYLDNKNQLVMTSNFDISPNYINGELNFIHKPPKKTDKILHPRFFPFDFAEISRIMWHKSNRPVDHHCRKDQQ